MQNSQTNRLEISCWVSVLHDIGNENTLAEINSEFFQGHTKISSHLSLSEYDMVW